MQPRIDTNLGIHGEPDAWVRSACILCSNGRGLDIAVKDGRIVGVRGSAGHPVSFGHLGPKGEHAWVANNSEPELLCLYGHNVAEVQTVPWERILAAKQGNGGRIMVADPRKTPTVHQGADLHLQLRPGTNVALMNGIIHP